MIQWILFWSAIMLIPGGPSAVWRIITNPESRARYRAARNS